MKVLRDDTTKKVSWENHTDYYIRVEFGTDEYMQALADDFKVLDSDGKMRIMSKSKLDGNLDNQTTRQGLGA